MLGLGQQVGRHPFGIVQPVGYHHDLGWTGQGVDANHAIEPALGGGDIGVAGTDDLVDWLDRSGAIGQGRHAMGAADTPDFCHSSGGRRRQHRRFQASRRGDHGNPADPGRRRRHGVHQYGRRIGRSPARYIDSHRIQRRPAPAQLSALGIGKALIDWTLTLVISADARGGEGDSLAHIRIGLGRARLDLLAADPQALGIQLDPVEAFGQAQHRVDTANAHLLQNIGNGGINIGRRAAPLIEKRRESAFKIGVGELKTTHA